MKALPFLFLVFVCVALGSCGASRPSDEGHSIFPDPRKYIRRDLSLVTSDTPARTLEVLLESITDEPADVYRQRYELFTRDPANRPLTIPLGSSIAVVPWPAGSMYYGEFLGYSLEGVLTSDSSGEHVYEFWQIDTLTEVATGKTFLRDDLNDLVMDNALPLRGVLHFYGFGGMAGVTNSAFHRASIARPAPAQVVENDGRPSVGEVLINTFFDILLSGDGDSDNDADKKDEPKKEEEKKEKPKTGRVSGEDRKKK